MPRVPHFAVLLLALTASAWAQHPPKLEPLPDPPPPPPGMELDQAQEPQVKKGEDTVEEYRVNGQLYMVKVTPPGGIPYYLFDDVGNGDFTRRDAQDTGLRVPKWIIKKW